MVKLSIVVTVYNGENTLNKCLDSLYQQTFQDFEIICVDDGSTDRSLQLLEREALNNSKVKVIHQNNQGVWFARKKGIEVASGKWIGFVDCDDTVVEKMYAKMISIGESTGDIDMVVCGFNKIDTETEKIYAKQMTSFGKSIRETRNNKGFLAVVNPSMCNKIFKHKICEKAINLEKAPRIMEDLIFTASILPLIRKVAFTDETLYQYYNQKNSVTKTIGYKDIEKAEDALISLKNFGITQNMDVDLLNLIAFLHLGVAMTINYNQLEGKSLRKIWKEIMDYLNTYFPMWCTNRYMTFSYCKENKEMWRLYLVRLIYKTYIYMIAVKIYHFFIYKLKIDIKW